MIFYFDWHGCQALDIEEKKEIQNKIKGDIESWSGEQFKPCHSGPVTIHLNIFGPLLSELVGNIKCKCGKPFLVINGASDGSR